MKYMSILASLALFIAPACLAAQSNYPPPNNPTPNNSSTRAWDHGEVAVFGDYFHFHQYNPSTSYVGIGGLASINTSPRVALEAEMTYDFAKNFTSSSSNGATTSFAQTSLRPITALFGPKFQFGTSGPFRAFLTGKAGFIDFARTDKTISGSSFTGAVNNIGNGNTFFAAYPGAGFEAFWGPIGIRAEAGDEIYLDNGVFNNIKVDVGPAFRF
jgi:hypothetical protein